MSSRDLLRQLDDEPDMPVATWTPAVGDTLVGVVKVLDMLESKFDNDLHPHLLIETEDGSLIHVYARHTVLAQELSRTNAGVGDRIAIRRLADVAGKSYKRYKVAVEHLSLDPDEYLDTEDQTEVN